MGNSLICGNKKSKQKSFTNPYLPSGGSTTAAAVYSAPIRTSVALAPNTNRSAAVLSKPPDFPSTITPRAALTPTKQILPKVDSFNRSNVTPPRPSTINQASLVHVNQLVAERKPNATHQANAILISYPPKENLTYATRVLASALVNRIRDDNEESETFTGGAFTFTNSEYQIKTNAEKQRNEEMKMTLKQYWPGNETRSFFKKKFKNFHICNSKGYHLIQLTHELNSNSNQLTQYNYLDALLIFADIEDLHCEEAIRVYNRKAEKVSQSPLPRNFVIEVPNLIDSCPSISVCGRLSISTNQLENFKPVYGTISEIHPTHILVEFYDKIDTTIKYDVNFLSNRITFRMEKLAIELMRQKNLVHLMFPKVNDKNSVSNNRRTEKQFSWYNKSVANNPEQKSVIESIYHGTSYPYPYIVFGPPGTGKTTTLVEAILQLWKNKPDSYILVVATSNFACNVISKHLLQFLSKTEIFRLFSKSQEVLINKIDTDVLDASNLKGKKHYTPQPSELYPYRVIVATPTSSGRLILEGFTENHFTHLFIDECGSCTEGSALIPIAGLISSQNKINAHIVLAGDPLQLRPVIYSKYVEDLGYGVSMIERLMQFSLYKVDDRIGDYNNKYITKLRINYRSHRNILHISNQLFYNSELKSMGSKEVTDWAINWEYLPNPKFPIKFAAVFGESLSENDSPSLYNNNEIDVVISHLNLLVNQNINGKMIRQSDIGVISPYRKQNQKIRSQCDKRRWRDIEVASVEAFQGSEKSIIIFSTVRSNVDTMGFLSNERRLNVALTRAKGLLIIIGDPKVLMMDKCWYQLMKYCYDNNAICGEAFDFYN